MATHSTEILLNFNSVSSFPQLLLDLELHELGSREENVCMDVEDFTSNRKGSLKNLEGYDCCSCNATLMRGFNQVECYSAN